MILHTLLEARLYNVREYKEKPYKSSNMNEKQQNIYLYEYVRTDMYIIICFDTINDIMGPKKKWLF